MPQSWGITQYKINRESGGCDVGGEVFEMLSSINGDDELPASGTPSSDEHISVKEEVHGEFELINLTSEVFSLHGKGSIDCAIRVDEGIKQNDEGSLPPK
ncbi:hypothetical protein AMTR_s00139p00103050 [Amborella trichopoda]|uniref:Uncharacterized protein n=1 Tax=Amborella trichopoda TaxID=13333 RepID=W1NDS9_AMBTC|nr:hypothetical protein AMTR_s00139p00103050 [Amborella trichopoda]